MLDRFAILVAGLTIANSPVYALNFCDDLWFTRNLMFDKAGYCFSSPLGKAVFGSEGCVGSRVRLDKPSQDMVARVQAAEKREGCNVDTSLQSLEIPLISVRKALIDPPFPSPFESTCIGWKGALVPLRSSRNATSEPIGEIRLGDTVLFQFENVGSWSFVEVSKNAEIVSMGWANVAFDEETCEMMAG